jgi:hypothetical protein
MTKKTETDGAAAVKDEVTAFDKQQIIKSRRYQSHRDLLTALLKDDRQYSHEDIEAMIADFMKGKVK